MPSMLATCIFDASFFHEVRQVSDTRTHFFVRLPVDLKVAIKRVAQRHGRSTTKEVQKIIENHVEKYESTNSQDAELVGLSR